jgi:subtilisin family serine protease
VRAVAVSGPRRMPLTVSQEYFTSDPYFNGFISTVPPSGSHTNPPATYHVAPYDESAAVPGQWDMHAIRLGYAFEYSQANNGSSVQNAGALGSGTIKIAMIDTGVDSTHPELANKVAYQHCFVTNPNTGSQSTSSFSTDPDGHGTDVTGVAAANTNNAFGYAAAGGNVVVYGYRVFPTPDDTCSDQNPLVTPGPLCTAEPADVASAINDAIAKGVNVISLSLGGAGTTNAPACTGGVDSDLTEGQAINAAIAHNIVVVAAAGNDATAALEAPACDTGVIAVGASALDDGQPNGSGVANGSPSNPLEYVAGYSDYGSPGAAPGSASAWGIVAPGGDPSGGDVDFLHWIINIWTSTPLDSQFAGDCFDDYPNIQGTTPPLDCSTLIAGTSMATPHVAGAAALILAVNSTYQSPAKMKQLLCSTADDIGSPHEGCGRLNIYRAMAVALHDPSPP